MVHPRRNPRKFGADRAISGQIGPVCGLERQGVFRLSVRGIECSRPAKFGRVFLMPAVSAECYTCSTPGIPVESQRETARQAATASQFRGLSKWDPETGLKHYAYVDSMDVDERKPSGTRSDGGGSGTFSLLPWLRQMPVPGEGRHFQQARGLDFARTSGFYCVLVPWWKRIFHSPLVQDQMELRRLASRSPVFSSKRAVRYVTSASCGASSVH